MPESISSGLVNSYKLLGILQEYAPDQRTQQVCADMYREMNAEGVPEHEMTAIFAGYIFTGIRFGNWPWEVN